MVQDGEHAKVVDSSIDYDAEDILTGMQLLQVSIVFLPILTLCYKRMASGGRAL